MSDKVTEEEYPEHKRQGLIRDKSSLIEEFLEWLEVNRNIHLRQYIETGARSDPCYKLYCRDGKTESGKDCSTCKGTGRISSNSGFFRPDESVKRLLAEYFDIDLGRIEVEKHRMLDKVKVDAV